MHIDELRRPPTVVGTRFIASWISVAHEPPDAIHRVLDLGRARAAGRDSSRPYDGVRI